jgi:hypothetical protein
LKKWGWEIMGMITKELKTAIKITIAAFSLRVASREWGQWWWAILPFVD